MGQALNGLRTAVSLYLIVNNRLIISTGALNLHSASDFASSPWPRRGVCPGNRASAILDLVCLAAILYLRNRSITDAMRLDTICKECSNSVLTFGNLQVEGRAFAVNDHGSGVDQLLTRAVVAGEAAHGAEGKEELHR